MFTAALTTGTGSILHITILHIMEFPIGDTVFQSTSEWCGRGEAFTDIMDITATITTGIRIMIHTITVDTGAATGTATITGRL